MTTDAKKCDCCAGTWGYINNEGDHDNVWDCVAELTRQRDTARRERDDARRALRFAAGVVSTMKVWSDKHPQDAYDWIVAQAQTAAARTADAGAE